MAKGENNLLPNEAIIAKYDKVAICAIHKSCFENHEASHKADLLSDQQLEALSWSLVISGCKV